MSHMISLSDDSTYIILEIINPELTIATLTDKDSELNIEITVEKGLGFVGRDKLGKEKGIKKYLMDCTDARNVDSVLNNYQFAYEDMRHTEGIDITAIVAAVVAPEDHSHDFIETTAKNSGLNVTLFRDKQKAIEFLKSK